MLRQGKGRPKSLDESETRCFQASTMHHLEKPGSRHRMPCLGWPVQPKPLTRSKLDHSPSSNLLLGHNKHPCSSPNLSILSPFSLLFPLFCLFSLPLFADAPTLLSSLFTTILFSFFFFLYPKPTIVIIVALPSLFFFPLFTAVISLPSSLSLSLSP